MSGGEGLVSRVLGCAEFFRILPWSGFEKKLQKFLLKSLELMKKSLPLQPLSETKRTFWNILTDVFFIFCGWSLQKLSSTAVPKKKFEKKVRKDLEGMIKSIYLCIRFRLMSGAGKREAKEFLKILKGLKQTASASPRINSTDIMTERKRYF